MFRPNEMSEGPSGPGRYWLNQDWIIPVLMELLRADGARQAKLEHLASDVQDIKAEMKDMKADIKDVKQALLRMEKVFYAATALTAFVGALVVRSANTAKELYLAGFKASTPQSSVGPAPSLSAPQASGPQSPK